MAKVNAPLMSFGASGSIADSLTFFPWKGLNAVRQHVIPANPRTTAQVTQRGYMSSMVALIHTAQALAVSPLAADDVAAYALLASTRPTPRTWFNEAVKEGVDQLVAGLKGAIMRAGASTPDDGALDVSITWTAQGENDITAGTFKWGTSKTALINSVAAVVAAGEATATISGLTNGEKYYWQFVPSAHADFVGLTSGIYSGVPAA